MNERDQVDQTDQIDEIDQTDELTAQLSCEFLVNVPHGDTVILVIEDRLVDCGFSPSSK